MPSKSRFRRFAGGLLVGLSLGLLSFLGFTSAGSLAANGYGGGGYGYGYGCPGYGYGYCPPTTTTTTTANARPVCGPITAPLAPVPVGAPVTATSPFSDPNPGDTHTAVMAWGDGTTSAGTVTEAAGSGTVSATHTYTAAGVYTLTLTVTDNHGLSGQCTFEFLVVFDATGGFVTGGGWIFSPAGSYTPDPTAAGTASFGFVSKYQKGASVPSGSTEFQFKAGDLNFKSTSYDWLVIAGAKAMYKGEGTINGTAGYSFQLSAIDGQAPGGGGVDTFRIRIWETATNVVIYDNKLGAGVNADPTSALGGGSITIHK
jgi:PKD domain